MEWLIVLSLMGILGGGYAYISHLERKRKQGLIALSRELELELNWQLPETDLVRFNQFEIANQGRLPTSGTTLIADDGETRLAVFDFSYTTGYGKHKRSHLFSIAMASSPKLALPTFRIDPQTWKSKIAELVGFSDIEIEEDPDFSKQFTVHGDDPVAIRMFLDSARRTAISQFPNQSLAGRSDSLLVIRKYGRLKPENIRQMMTEALLLVKAMRG